MNKQLQMSDFVRLGKRFILPAIAVLLLHTGIWLIIVFNLTTPVMSGVSKSINWILEQFYAGNGRIVETDWMIKYTTTEGAEGLLAIALGILVGAFVLRSQKKKALA